MEHDCLCILAVSVRKVSEIPFTVNFGGGILYQLDITSDLSLRSYSMSEFTHHQRLSLCNFGCFHSTPPS